MTQIPIFSNDFLPIAKAAIALHASRSTTYRWVKAGKLIGFTIGGSLFVPLSAIKRFENNRYGQPARRK